MRWRNIKTSFWHFCQSATLPGSVNMKVSPYIWNRKTFKLQPCMHCESTGSLEDESCTIGYVSQLNLNWRAHNRTGFFNGLELYMKLELSRRSCFGSKSWFCYSAFMGINIRFRGPIVKLKLEIRFIYWHCFNSIQWKIVKNN